MKCSQVIEILGSLCRHELEDDMARAAQAHVASCARCMKEKQLMARVMGAMGDLERIEPSEDFTVRLSERIDEWEARRRVFWLASLAGFIRSHRRTLATATAVFVFSLVTSVFVIQRMGPEEEIHMAEGVVSPVGLAGAAPESFVMRDITRPVGTTSDSVYMHYVTGDRPAYPGEGQEDYIFRPVVRPVSGSARTF